MRIFIQKSVKIASASGTPLPKPRWPPAAGGSAPTHPCCYSRCCYNFVELVSSTKCVLLPTKKEKTLPTL